MYNKSHPRRHPSGRRSCSDRTTWVFWAAKEDVDTAPQVGGTAKAITSPRPAPTPLSPPPSSLPPPPSKLKVTSKSTTRFHYVTISGVGDSSCRSSVHVTRGSLPSRLLSHLGRGVGGWRNYPRWLAGAGGWIIGRISQSAPSSVNHR